MVGRFRGDHQRNAEQHGQRNAEQHEQRNAEQLAVLMVHGAEVDPKARLLGGRLGRPGKRCGSPDF